jgi:hypothetical protein
MMEKLLGVEAQRDHNINPAAIGLWKEAARQYKKEANVINRNPTQVSQTDGKDQGQEYLEEQDRE